MGYANRQRLDFALGMDTQPRRLCLSSSRRRHSNPYANTNSDCHINAVGNTYRHTDTYSHSYTESDSNPKASSNSAAATVTKRKARATRRELNSSRAGRVSRGDAFATR
jgi:hypothetical protein